MTFEITYQPDDEEVTIIVDDVDILKASLGAKKEIRLNDKFRELESEQYELYLILHRLVKELFKLTDV